MQDIVLSIGSDTEMHKTSPPSTRQKLRLLFCTTGSDEVNYFTSAKPPFLLVPQES